MTIFSHKPSQSGPGTTEWRARAYITSFGTSANAKRPDRDRLEQVRASLGIGDGLPKLVRAEVGNLVDAALRRQP